MVKKTFLLSLVALYILLMACRDIAPHLPLADGNRENIESCVEKCVSGCFLRRVFTFNIKSCFKSCSYTCFNKHKCSEENK